MNILLTSVGRRTYMVEYFREALNNTGLIHASNNVLTYTLQKADKWVITPSIYDSNYINFLRNYCKENDINAIISLFDIDLPILAEHKEEFGSIGTTVVVSERQVIDVCNDKWKSHLFIKSLGLPQTRCFLSVEETKEAIEAQNIDFPLFIKPRWGMGSIGIYKACNMRELEVFTEKLKRDVFETYLKYESNQDKDHCIIIQEAIVGTEYGLDILNDLGGNYVTTISKRKIAMRAGETDVAMIVDNSLFSPIAKKLSSALKHIGNLDVDCFITDKNELVILEMNCRFGGQYPFSHLAGADFPKQIVNWLKGCETDNSLTSAKTGLIACKEIKPILFNTSINNI